VIESPSGMILIRSVHTDAKVTEKPTSWLISKNKDPPSNDKSMGTTAKYEITIFNESLLNISSWNPVLILRCLSAPVDRFKHLMQNLSPIAKIGFSNCSLRGTTKGIRQFRQEKLLV
jgi:hypothetical protein